MKNLKDAYADYFMIGAAVNAETVKSHSDLLIKHFNSITCENEMKFISLRPRVNIYDYRGADEIHSFAVENNIAMRGHTLVWHNQVPDFLFEKMDREFVLEILNEQMRLISGRYAKNVYAWDVVNEAVADEDDVYLRKTKWLEILGEDYLAEVFNLAAGYFKGIDLYYNDYGEMSEPRRGKIVRLVKELQSRGVPIHGVGLQSHSGIDRPTIDEVKESFEVYAALGLKLCVTELDVSVYDTNDSEAMSNPGAEIIERQAEYYRRLFQIYREYRQHIESVTFWGIADDATWLDHFPEANRKNWPLLFDENHEPKEALLRILEF